MAPRGRILASAGSPRLYGEIQTKTTPSETYLGIDVGKAWLDLAVWGSDTLWRVPNDEHGVAEITARMATLPAQLIAVEASGGCEQRLVQALLLANLPVAVVNPGCGP